MRDIVIYGGGGHCYALIELINSLDGFNITEVLDDNPSVSDILGVPVRESGTNRGAKQSAAIAIGNNAIRKRIGMSLKCELPNFQHKSSVVYPSVVMGKGVQILPLSVIDADVQIGDFTIINNNATVSHNTKIGSFVHIAINAAVAGDCIIGEGSLIGAGAVVLPGIKIGAWATVGAGAIVTRDVPDHATVMGNPARIKNLPNEK